MIRSNMPVSGAFYIIHVIMLNQRNITKQCFREKVFPVQYAVPYIVSEKTCNRALKSRFVLPLLMQKSNGHSGLEGLLIKMGDFKIRSLIFVTVKENCD